MGLRIVQISRECSSNGGVGTYVCNLVSTLQSRGHEVSIIHADLNADSSLKEISQFHVEGFDEYTTAQASEKSVSEVLKILKSINPSIVHIQSCNNFYLEFEIRKHFPAIKSLHTYDFCPSGNKFHHALQKPCIHPTSALCVPRMIYKRCLLSKRPHVIWKHYRRAVEANDNNYHYEKLIVASEFVKVQAVASGYRANQVEVIPYYTKLPLLDTTSTFANNKVLFIGRIVPEKGLKKLLSVFSKLRTPAEFVVAGDGWAFPKIKRMSQKLGLANRISFTGWLNPDQKNELYKESSVVVVPSLWPEPFGIVGIEAMSYAKPVVAFRVGGISDWLDDGKTGFLIAPYDVIEMASKIDSLLQKKELAHEMGTLGRAKVEQRFSEAQHINLLLETYKKIIDSRNLSGSHCDYV